MQGIDYQWDAKIDGIIDKYYKSINKKDYDKTKLNLKAYKNNLSLKQRLKYLSARNITLYNFLRKIKRLTKRNQANYK